MTYVLDFDAVHPTLEVLQEALIPWAEAVKRGQYGKSSIVVSTRNEILRTYVESIAVQHSLPIFVSFSTTPFDVSEADAALPLSATEEETMSAVTALGGKADAAQLASYLRLRHTAATNRLVGISNKGYLHRQKRAGRSGDLFLDPRLPSLEYSTEAVMGQVRGAVSEPEAARAHKLLKKSLRNAGGLRTRH